MTGIKFVKFWKIPMRKLCSSNYKKNVPGSAFFLRNSTVLYIPLTENFQSIEYWIPHVDQGNRLFFRLTLQFHVQKANPIISCPVPFFHYLSNGTIRLSPYPTIIPPQKSFPKPSNRTMVQLLFNRFHIIQYISYAGI